ncbi:MAG: DUF3592 domain-containing protein [Planctomycetota bacterium]
MIALTLSSTIQVMLGVFGLFAIFGAAGMAFFLVICIRNHMRLARLRRTTARIVRIVTGRDDFRLGNGHVITFELEINGESVTRSCRRGGPCPFKAGDHARVVYEPHTDFVTLDGRHARRVAFVLLAALILASAGMGLFGMLIAFG